MEILLPSAERDGQGSDDDVRFRKERDEFLADGKFSVISKILSIVAYKKHMGLNYGNPGSTL